MTYAWQKRLLGFQCCWCGEAYQSGKHPDDGIVQRFNWPGWPEWCPCNGHGLVREQSATDSYPDVQAIVSERFYGEVTP